MDNSVLDKAARAVYPVIYPLAVLTYDQALTATRTMCQNVVIAAMNSTGYEPRVAPVTAESNKPTYRLPNGRVK